MFSGPFKLAAMAWGTIFFTFIMIYLLFGATPKTYQEIYGKQGIDINVDASLYNGIDLITHQQYSKITIDFTIHNRNPHPVIIDLSEANWMINNKPAQNTKYAFLCDVSTDDRFQEFKIKLNPNQLYETFAYIYPRTVYPTQAKLLIDKYQVQHLR